MATELLTQIENLLTQGDTESVKFLISDEQEAAIHSLAQQLPAQLSEKLRDLYEEVREEDQSLQLQEPREKEARNRKIDKQLEEAGGEKKEESYLESISKIYEKLIYEQHFGFPFYDLFKRILATHGDAHPALQTVKTMHSQVLILYASLFSEEVLAWIADRHPAHLHQGFKDYFAQIFPSECEKYTRFQTLYRNLKKETSDEPVDQEEEDEAREMQIAEDETLELDEKEFLVGLSEAVASDDFQQFLRNRSYNFLCFGMRRYQAYTGLGAAFFLKVKEREFCELLSFLTIRFIRKIIFTINRQRHPDGKLHYLKEPITPQEIKREGNDLVDSYIERIEQYLRPVRAFEEIGMNLFLEEFQTYNYREFLPSRYVSEARERDEELSLYAWKQSKEYRTMWSERAKAEQFARQGGERPKVDYLKHIDENRYRFDNDSCRLWKEYAMTKLGFDSQSRVLPRKKMKLSIEDEDDQ